MTNKVLAIVTGASKGFGYAICQELVKKFPVIDFVLFSRSVEGLNKTKQYIQSKNENSDVSITSLDMFDIAQIDNLFNSTLDKVQFTNYQRVLLFNNHGSLSYLQHVKDLTDFQQINKDITLNVTSFVQTCSIFLKKVEKLDSTIPITVVNVSSLCAIKPFESWGIYCIGKAARNMTIQVIAEECKKTNKNIKTLNYGPGPMDTDIQQEVRDKTSDPETKKYFVDLKESGKLVDTNVSAGKMLNLIVEDKFETGSHVDFFTLP
eukprot:gene4616-5767_t